MIESFSCDGSADIFHGMDAQAARAVLPSVLWDTARRKLDQLDAAHALKDLASPPGNRLERLQGDLRGRYSIRINRQYRIVLTWSGGNAHEVYIHDYH